MSNDPSQHEAHHSPKRKSLGQAPFTDLLLTFIVFLVVLKLSIPIISDFIAAQSDQINLSLVITCLVLFQNVLMLKLVHFFILKKHGLNWKDAGLRPATTKWCYNAILFAIPLVFI
ncbi:hypothetical protein A9Q97_05025, partial [Rhodospirillales bacterium 47_12_T64]